MPLLLGRNRIQLGVRNRVGERDFHSICVILTQLEAFRLELCRVVFCVYFEFTRVLMWFVRGFWNVSVVGASAARYKRVAGNEFAGSALEVRPAREPGSRSIT